MKLSKLQGNIFDIAEQYELTIVFGHKGLNLLSIPMTEFLSKHNKIYGISDPFQEIPNMAVKYEPDRNIWFMPEEEMHGISDERLKIQLKSIFDWASSNGCKTILFNGAQCIDYKKNNIVENKERVQLIEQLIYEFDKNHNGYFKEVCLISLSTAFID